MTQKMFNERCQALSPGQPLHPWLAAMRAWAAAVQWRTRPRWVALVLALWCTLGLNQAWWGRLAQLASEQQLSFLQKLAAVLVLTAATALWFLLLSWPRVRTPAWTLTLVVAAAVQYFMLHYGIVMDASMVRNALQTNASEGWALMSMGLIGHVLLMAGLPLLWLRYGVALQPTRWQRDLWRSSVLALACVAVVVGGGLWLYKPMAPLVRNHTEIRYLINPLATVVSVTDVTLKPLFKTTRRFERISDDAVLGATYGVGGVQPVSTGAGTATAHKPPLLVLVVGETTRSDHFGLNGYPRNTTPQLEARNVISWRHVTSCGTNTLASVPCMFSHLGKTAFESRKADYENLLDVLQRAGLRVDWLDNQAGCKEVCNRVAHAQADQVASAQAQQRWCKDAECLDQLMVELLDQRLKAATEQPGARGVVLVLHQMGSHGPAYYRRSSQAAKRFQPECTTHVTSDCSHTELVNVYDNSMMETDLFVSRTIDWLQKHDKQFETGLIYLADHGESLGENGIYLHGLPYIIAPDAQKQVPWVLWPGQLLARTGVSANCLRVGIEQPLTHDHFYHTVLGMLDVHSHTYQSQLDAWAACRNRPATAIQSQTTSAVTKKS